MCIRDSITALAIGICNGASMVLAASEGTHLVYSPVYIEKELAKGTYVQWKAASLKIINDHYKANTAMGKLIRFIVNEVLDTKEDSVAFTLSTLVDELEQSGEKFSLYASHHNNRYTNAIRNAMTDTDFGNLQTALAHPGGAFYFACLEYMETNFVKINAGLGVKNAIMESGGVAHESLSLIHI